MKPIVKVENLGKQYLVIHHAGHGTKQRWLEQERLLAKRQSYYLFCRTSLSRWHYLGNLMTMYVLSAVQLAWRKLSGLTIDDEKIMLRLHFAELRKLLRGGNSARSERNQASS